MGDASFVTAFSENPRLYLHCIGSLPSLRTLGDAIPGFDRYPERALLMASRGDVVCVPCEVDPEYLDFLGHLGIGPAPCDVIAVTRGRGAEPVGPLTTRLLESTALLQRIGRAVGRRGSLELHPYVATPEVFLLANALELATRVKVRVLAGRPGLTDRADQKHNIRTKALELGIPVAEGEVIKLAPPGVPGGQDFEPMRAAVERQIAHTGRVIVRGASGASGSSTYVVGTGGEDASSVIASIAARTDNQIFLVEAMVDVTASPNLQMHVDPDSGAVTCLGVTDQRWGEALVHTGNGLPTAAETVHAMEEWAGIMAGWLRDEGYAGIVGFDFVEYRDLRTGAPRSFLAEVNPRVNGGTYPLALRERLNVVRRREGWPDVGAFVSGTVETGARTFTQLREALGELMFSHERGAGIVPYATGCLAYGKCAVASLAASGPEALDLYAESEAAVGAVCVLD